jgi:hypothetical protein
MSYQLKTLATRANNHFSRPAEYRPAPDPKLGKKLASARSHRAQNCLESLRWVVAKGSPENFKIRRMDDLMHRLGASGIRVARSGIFLPKLHNIPKKSV